MELGTCTYSPEDNKLRFYPAARLSKEDYNQARGAGFIWAPKQELFVAPMWTPEREDLMLEWCGGIGDEDSSLLERSEQRAERFSEYSDHREADANSAHQAVAAIADGIPLGQPILVGHHSERHARRDAEKIENGMRRAVKCWEQSKYWDDRARGAIRAAKYKERPDVRARRIKTLEAARRKQIRTADEYQHTAKFWEGKLKLRNPTTGETRPMEVNYENAIRFTGCDCTHLSFEFPLTKYPRSLPASQYEGAMSMYSALGGSDGPDHAIVTVEQAKELCLQVCSRLMGWCGRWIAHYDHRLAYETAMLAADGGTAADQTGPQAGGACKCWASHRGGWSYIAKVNRVSVSVWDNWGNGGANFLRTMPFDKLSGVMTAAQVQAARDSANLVEYADKTGFCLINESNGKQAAALAQETGDQRRLRMHLEAIRNSGAACECKDCQAAGIGKAKPFEAMREALKTGVQVVVAPQLFPTPADLARRLVELAQIRPGDRVLEPSAGTGSLLDPMFNAQGTGALFDPDNSRGLGLLVAVEINQKLAARLATEYASAVVVRGDFLEQNGELGAFDRIVMNPPFENGSDIRHINKAYTLLKAGGRLVAICAAGPRRHKMFSDICSEWIDLPADSFPGTSVNTAIVILEKP